MSDLKALRIVDRIGAINWERLHEYVDAAEALAEAVRAKFDWETEEGYLSLSEMARMRAEFDRAIAIALSRYEETSK